MREGVSADYQAWFAEESRQRRRVAAIGSEDLAARPVASVDDLTRDDGEGGSDAVFILGLHDPFDSVPRMIVGPT